MHSPCREPLQIRFVPDPRLLLAGEQRVGLGQDERVGAASRVTLPRVIPYGIDDSRIGVAYAPLGQVLADMSSAS